MMICCVKTGSKYGPEYVRNLQAGVQRHIKGHHVFTCYTDDPVEGVLCEELPADLPGWWAKIGLFKLREPLLYFDLDVVITGDLTPVMEWHGFGSIKDWIFPGFNSSVMKLTGEEDVWDRFQGLDINDYPQGDQQLISECIPTNGRTFPREWFPSYKFDHCQNAVPGGAKAVIFHGRPKPPECGGWVTRLWQRSNNG
jgi:hypothetical protein